jgi:FAD/FMN-containing dehydrogenase
MEGNSMGTLLNEQIAKLRGALKSRIIFPDDPDYEETRRVWNAMIDKRPAAIIQCADVQDIPYAIAVARESGLEISVRGAGHNIAGSSVCNNGLMIDFSRMKNVHVDPGKRRAYAEAGATLGDFDRAVQMHGLATPLGINSTTGIAGLTLGGGFGWLTRKHGMTIDNLVSAEIVTADGKKITANESSNTDLFWAIRGGGGNFGIVTRFEFWLHPVGPEILAGIIVFPFEQARQVITRYGEFAASTPLDFNAWIVMRHAPPLPFLPPQVHGKRVVVLPVFYSGTSTEGEKLIDSLRGLGSAYGEHVGRQPYIQWQQTFDALLAPGSRNYWKSHNFKALSDGAIDSMIEYAAKLPTAQCEIFLGLIAGVSNDVPSDAMAYGARDAKFVLNVHGRWDDAAQDDTCIAWAREFFNATAPYACAGAYVNFMTAEEDGRVESAYGSNYARLREIKRKYDPENVFHLNQNIKP